MTHYQSLNTGANRPYIEFMSYLCFDRNEHRNLSRFKSIFVQWYIRFFITVCDLLKPIQVVDIKASLVLVVGWYSLGNSRLNKWQCIENNIQFWHWNAQSSGQSKYFQVRNVLFHFRSLNTSFDTWFNI